VKRLSMTNPISDPLVENVITEEVTHAGDAGGHA
jgi:hypothetical protein